MGGYGALSGAVTGAIAGGIDGGVSAYQSGRDIWTGKLNNNTLIERAGAFANTYVEETGHVGGSKKHTAAEKAVRRVQRQGSERNLKFEYVMEEEGKRSIRVDVYDSKNKIIYGVFYKLKSCVCGNYFVTLHKEKQL